MRSKFLISVVAASCVGMMWLSGHLYQKLSNMYEQAGTLTDLEYSWYFRLLLNLAGYSTVMVPGFILYKYLEKTNYFDKISHSNSLAYRVLRTCLGPQARLPEPGALPPAPAPDPRREGLELLFCFVGLMGAYLVWGLLQEKIMTQKYLMADGSVVLFSDSQLLVFVNRLAALLVAGARLAATRRPLAVPPLYMYSYCALSNVVSAWCQYEALKYVSFPTQVLSKSCKVIPVMVMGTLVSRNKYEAYEYITAALISLGMLLFMFGSTAPAPAWWAGGGGLGLTAGGLALLAVYMSCDAFTSSWQAALFQRLRPRPLQMLVGVNLASCLLTAAALCRPRASPGNMALLQHPGFVADVGLLCASSTAGQLLIYRTIARFGAVAFAIIMTLRQAVSILLSCLVYGHAVSAGGAAGVALVFAAVLLRVYCAHRMRGRTRGPPASAPRG